MPMGGCDKSNDHISDYLENSLDPAARAEFEQELGKSPGLKTTTNQVLKLTSLLGKLPTRKCSDDFVVTLRQRINSVPERKSSKVSVRRYSFAFSFIIIMVIAIFGIKSLLKKEEPAPVLPTMDEYQSAPASVSGGAVNTPVSSYSTPEDVDIKTRAESKMVKDTSDILEKDQNNNQAKQVGHTTK
jgi:hypothetical protein